MKSMHPKLGCTLAFALAALAAPAAAAPVVVDRPGPGLTPAEIQRLYHAAPALAGGTTGRGSRIAVIVRGEDSLADVAAFRSRFGLPPTTVEQRVVEGAHASTAAEATIVTEWVGALAPEAALTAVIGDPWVGLTLAITEDLAPILVVPDLPGEGPSLPAHVSVGTVTYGGLVFTITADGVVTVTYEGRRIATFRVRIDLPSVVLTAGLLNLAEQQGQAILVAAGSELISSPALTRVGGTEQEGAGERVWNDAAGVTEGGADVAAVASPLHPGYAFVLHGETRCCAGGTGLATALWGGVAALLTRRPPATLSTFLADAGERQAAGGIIAFNDVTVGDTRRSDDRGGLLLFDTSVAAGPGFDAASGWGSPNVTGLVAAVDCFGVDCNDGNPCTADACAAGGRCPHGPAPDGTGCSDLDACTVGDACQAGVCIPGRPATCRDAGSCTVDTCDSDLGCLYSPRDDDQSCQILPARLRGGRCALDWVVEAAAGAVGPHQVVCRDGDPDCDHDAVPGRCTFRMNVCATRPESCVLRRVRVVRPSPREARRSVVAHAIRTALERSLPGRLAGRCTAASELVVPAGGRGVRLRLEGYRGSASRMLRLSCRAGSEVTR